MSTSEVQQALANLGWPLKVDGSFGPRTREAVRDFQAGFAFYDLIIDGKAGPNTQAALRRALTAGGRCAPHFRFAEFACPATGWIKVNRLLVRGLEKYRDHFGPVEVISAYRSAAHNKAVGGVRNSQHLYGSAVDLPPKASQKAVEGLKVFSGIGINRRTGLVSHVDVRGRGGAPGTGATPRKPDVWFYDR